MNLLYYFKLIIYILYYNMNLHIYIYLYHYYDDAGDDASKRAVFIFKNVVFLFF